MKKRLYFDETVSIETDKLYVIIHDNKIREYHGFNLTTSFISVIMPNPNIKQSDLDYKVFELNDDFKLKKIGRYDRNKRKIKANYQIDSNELFQLTMKDVFIRLNFIEKFFIDYAKKESIFHEMKFKQKVLFFFLFSIPALLIGYFLNNLNNHSNNAQRLNPLSQDITNGEVEYLKIVKINTPSVVFFIPSKEVIDSIINLPEHQGIDEYNIPQN